MQLPGQPVKPDAVSGQRDLRPGLQRRDALDDPRQPAPQQRLAASEPDLSDTQPGDREPDQPD